MGSAKHAIPDLWVTKVNCFTAEQRKKSFNRSPVRRGGKRPSTSEITNRISHGASDVSRKEKIREKTHEINECEIFGIWGLARHMVAWGSLRP